MVALKYTLIADGSSDKTLLRIIKWSLDNLYSNLPNDGNCADFRLHPNPPKTLREKAREAGKYYPFDILFVHRDAEKTDTKMIAKRMAEIKKEIEPMLMGKTVCVIPVKMMETWLLIEEEAIKRAAGNRNYKGTIDLPQLTRLEKESQPKQLLHRLLEEASGLKGRNKRRLNHDKAVHLVAEYIEDFSPLRKLDAFRTFEDELRIAVDNYLKY